MKALVVLTVLAGIGCGEIPQSKPAQDSVGQEMAFPALVAKDLKGRRFAICEFAHRIVQARLGTSAKSPSCLDDQAQVQDAGDGHFSIRSWADTAEGRREYSGDATIAELDGVPRTIRITRLDLGGAK